MSDLIPDISIITVCRNAESFLEGCLQSVVEQEQSNIEHIVVDGASTDNTVSMLEGWAAKYPHIRWISEPDKGISDALNKGIRMARGRILGVLNVDDRYLSNAFSHVLPVLGRGDSRPLFIYGGLKVKWPESNNEWTQCLPRLTKFSPFAGVFPWNPAAYFYAKELHDLAGYYQVDDHCTMDLRFLIKALPLAQMVYVPHVLGEFIMHPGSITMRSVQAGEVEANKVRVIREALQAVSRWTRWQIRAFTLAYRIYDRTRSFKIVQRLASFSLGSNAT